MEVLPSEMGGTVEDAAGLSLPLSQTTGLSFEQLGELLLLHMEHERLKYQDEVEKRKCEVDKALALEKMKCDRVG